MVLLLKNLVFTLVMPGTLGIYLPWYLAPSAPPGLSRRLLACVVLALGGGLYAAAVWAFAAIGGATPFPLDAPKRLVIVGMYRYVRNPMYVAVLTVIAGWALWFHSTNLLIYGAVVALGFHLFVLAYEEPHLTREFDGEYRAYCREVRRWIPVFRH